MVAIPQKFKKNYLIHICIFLVNIKSSIIFIISSTLEKEAAKVGLFFKWTNFRRRFLWYSWYPPLSGDKELICGNDIEQLRTPQLENLVLPCTVGLQSQGQNAKERKKLVSFPSPSTQIMSWRVNKSI